MKCINRFFVGAMIIAAVTFTGCGGGGAEIKATNSTLGQELIDLQEARESGALTDKEYEKAKKNLLKRYR